MLTRPTRRTVAVASVLAVLTLPSTAVGKEFLLSIGGAPLHRFFLSCRLVDDGNVQTAERKALTPQRYLLTADAVSCAVSMTDARGRLDVRLESGGRTIAQASVNAIYGRIRVRSAGPWGGAGSSTSARSFPVKP